MESLVVIAPHCDDEVIGCYTALMESNSSVVIFLYEVDAVRKQEATKSAAFFGFTPLFPKSLKDALTYVSTLRKNVEVLIPSRTDAHKDHKTANRLFMPYATGFYSVDMVTANPLSSTTQTKKRLALDTCYTSQSELWNNNAKYYLFEDIQLKDWVAYDSVVVAVNKVEYTISYNKLYTRQVLGILALRQSDATLEDCFKLVMSVAAGKVTVSLFNNIILESN